MSEISNHRENKMQALFEFSMAVINNDNVAERFKQNKNLIDNLAPVDVYEVVDLLVREQIPMDKLKKGINKMMNLFYNSINKYPYESPEKRTFLWFLVQNYAVLDKKLKQLRPVIKQINKNPQDQELWQSAKKIFSEVYSFVDFYTIKENILFPEIEKKSGKYRCVQVMWSFHDDIRRLLKDLENFFEANSRDLKLFNKITGELYFKIYAVKFRDEKILFPVIQRIIPPEIFDRMLVESKDLTFPYLKPRETDFKFSDNQTENCNKVHLPTGTLTIEQIDLIFGHLPVDITYVDENNKVRYFSTPKSRIFPRTKAVIGRDVENCHPPESVHIVNRIVEAFRSGEKNEASFWIKVMGKFVLIRYFAVRDNDGNYKGVLEVSQEIDNIVGLEGEKRLLDWE